MGKRGSRAGAFLLALLVGCGWRTGLDVDEEEPRPPHADAGPGDAGLPPPELCDGRDDDGDGEVDETCGCGLGERRECLPPPPTPDAETCAPGMQRCAAGRWGPCEGGVFCVEVEDRFVYSDAVDVVLVVDQSPSLLALWERVVENLERLARSVASSERSYRLILLASRSTDHGLCLPPPLTGPPCEETERFRQIDDYVGSWNSLAMIEAHLDSIETLGQPWAQRWIVVVTEDDSDRSGLEFHNRLRRRSGWADYVFHAVVGTFESTCELANVGWAYEWLAMRTGGALLDVCDADWATAFDAIARDVVRRPRLYPLSRRPWDTPRVLAGDPPEALAPELWTYDDAQRLVAVRREAALAPGTPLVARYRAPL